ncbi:MAG: tryptophan--tRNA ligase [Candidatus Parabeggiatoa sp. nov. 2]|nr:MAG: tryptophan--tRNA ligase [Beggiatoa sp. 4572_84]
MNSSISQQVLSGMRPTGQLHLGHLHGVLKNWVQLQHEHRCYFFVADWHALTTEYDNTSVIAKSVWDMVIDWLAVGINPGEATLFIQSKVPEHAELHLLLSMSTPLSWLERIPSYKDQQQKLKDKDLSTYGFLGYPLLQSADILVYKAGLVPVALETAQALVDNQQNISLGDKKRLLGYLEGSSKTILPEPEPLLTQTAKMPGLDGQKMSKSYKNTIALREPPAAIDKKIRTMPTDPARMRRTDPGDPEKCPVWQFHKIYSNEETKTWVQNGCSSAGIGCLECKQPVIESILAELAPIRERALGYIEEPESVRAIVSEGCEQARATARETLDEVRQAMGLAYR